MSDWKDQLQKLKSEQNTQIKQKRGGAHMPEKITFLDEKGIIRSELLEAKAEEWARSFIRPPSRDQGLKASQLRKFYNDAKALKTRLDAQKNFDAIKPLIKMIKSKAAYACPQRGNKKIPTEFKNYLALMVNSVDTEEQFRAFLLCFEAVVGYFYGLGGRQQ